MEDTLKFGSETSLSSFAFGVPQADPGTGLYSSQAQLGLGRNSTFLRTLASAGGIGTRAYSLFWGLMGVKQTQGSLVLGGLDKSLIADQDANLTAQLVYTAACPTGMLVTINDILLNWPNGTDQSIFGGSESEVFQACINPNAAGLVRTGTPRTSRLMREERLQTASPKQGASASTSSRWFTTRLMCKCRSKGSSNSYLTTIS
jgi:hypothetical protein